MTEQEARAIKASDEPRQILAARLGVSPAMVDGVRRGRTWRHVSDMDADDAPRQPLGSEPLKRGPKVDPRQGRLF
jgi:hypothetical protein